MMAKKSTVFAAAICAAACIAVIIASIGSAFFGSTLVFNENDNSFRREYMSAEAAVRKGGVAIEQTSRRVLIDEGMNSVCYPASTTKVLTALTVLNNCSVGETVTVAKEAAGIEGSSIYLKAGEKMSVGDLLYGLMLRSGNDAAAALAIHVSGSVGEFAELMNATAESLGAVNSNFVNPHGLHDDAHYTTPYDLALITAAAYENAEFRRIVATKTKKISGEDGGRCIGNKNKLLTMYEGADGVKTGYTTKSGRCLVGSAVRDGMRVITVVLNYPDMWNDSIRMLDTCFREYEIMPIELALSSDGGRTVEIGVSHDEKGDMLPRFYPMRRDGSERAVAV